MRALNGVDLTIEQGEFIAIEGSSGSGKSTLLNDIALLHVPTEGDYYLDGVRVNGLSEKQRAALRSQVFGFVFQSFHLLDGRPVLDSVELGLFYRGVPSAQRRSRALSALAQVGLTDKADQRAQNLSGGERQRVAIARALAVGAPVIVADEPTGNLDSANSAGIVDLLRSVAAQGQTVVLVTHDPAVAAAARRRIRVRDGVIVSDTFTEESGRPTPAAEMIGMPNRGRDSTVRLLDGLNDALSSLRARRSRAAALIAAVGVAVALAVSTLGISGTASAQVSDRFNATLNTQVTVSKPTGLVVDHFAPSSPAETDRALLELAGVAAAGTLLRVGDFAVSSSSEHSPRSTSVFGATDGLLEAARLSVEWSDPAAAGDLQDGAVLLGEIVADELDVGPLTLTPAVIIDGRRFAVAGIITSSDREASLMSGVLMVVSDAEAYGQALEVRWFMLTQPGAAPNVASQAPLLLRPTAPADLNVDAPVDPDRLRASIQADLRTTLLVLTAVAALASAVGLTNSMVMSVVERSREYGLRRALGATPRHIVASVMTESFLIGALGGLAGLVLGLTGVLLVTMLNRWIPVFDIRTGPVAILGGIGVAMFGGIVAAIRAARIQPADALKS